MTNEALAKQIGGKIEFQRKKLKLSQEAFGNKIGLSRSSIVNLEKGRHNLSLEMLYKICTLFNLGLMDILVSIPEYYGLKNVKQGTKSNYEFLDDKELSKQQVADIISIYEKAKKLSDEQKD